MTTQQCAHCGSPRPATQANCNVCGLGDQQPAQTLRAGALLSNRFKIDRVLGRGGFGIAYKAFDLTIDRTVAIKEFFPAGSVRAEYGAVTSAGTDDFSGLRAAFLREGRALGQFRENGIVQVFDVVEANSTAYIVMEYLNGETLEQRLVREGPLPRDVVRHWTLEILRSLEKVHAAGLLHRDISPTNVILEPERGPVLIDFGAARFLQSERTATLVLKHGYAPPEQYQTHGRLGPWTDIYALSATLSRVLTGLVPLSAIDRLSGGELPPMITERAGDPLYRAILAGLVLRSEDRVPSAAAFRAMIETPTHTVYAGPGATTAQPPGFSPALPSVGVVPSLDTVAPFGAAPTGGHHPTFRPGDSTVGQAPGVAAMPPATASATPAPPAPFSTALTGPFSPPPPVSYSPPPPVSYSPPPVGATVVGQVGGHVPGQVGGQVGVAPNFAPPGPPRRRRLVVGVGVVALLAAVGLAVAQPWKSSKASVSAKPGSTDTVIPTTTADSVVADSIVFDTVSRNTEAVGPTTTIAVAEPTTVTSPPDTTLAPDTTTTADIVVEPTTLPSSASEALLAYTNLAAPTNVLGPANLFGGFAMAPDGATLVYAKAYQGIYQLYALDRTSGKEQILTTSRSNKGWPSLSFDGKFVAYSASIGVGDSAKDKIFVAPFTAKASIPQAKEKRLTTSKDSGDDNPFFSRDGALVYFTTDRDGSFDVHQIGVDGTNELPVLSGIKDDYGFGVTPDGRGILVLRAALGSSSGFDVLLYDLATQAETDLTDTTDDEYSPALSPDGKVVVFSRDIDGQRDLYAVDVATGTELRLTDTAVNEDFPVFTPSGDGIIFSARSEEGTTVQQLALRRSP